jgi:signal transduction histidine kinase
MGSPIRQFIQAIQEVIDGHISAPIQETFADEIGELAAKFNEMLQVLGQREIHTQELEKQLRQVNREVIRAKQTQAQFLSDVSHELRTPLTAIRSFCDLLLMFGDDDPAAREEFLQSIIESCDRLTRLINNILDSSKIEAGKLEWNIERIDLIEVIRSSTRIMAAMAQEKGLKIVTQLPVQSLVLDGDRDRLIQVLTNLINNAIKFTEKGQITVGMEETPKKVKVGVADTGIGIAPEHQDLIFERFAQVRSRSQGKPSGTGLGLAICKEIVEHHKGEIWVESEVGKGSAFYFTLPVLSNSEANPNV